MANLIWGIAVVVMCAALYIYAWRLARAKQYGPALAIITLCGLFLRVYVAADANLHDWDERYHALVGKHLAEHWLRPTLYETPLLPYDYRDWTTSHIWLHKQPLALWLIAGNLKTFGNYAFAVRLPAILLTTAAIPLVYGIGRQWYGRNAGMLAAFLASIHGLIIELAAGRAGTDSIDAVFFFFVALSIWLCLKAVAKKSVAAHLLAGIALGLGILTKWLPALVVAPVWAIAAWPAFRAQQAKMIGCGLCLLGAAIVIALPWQLYIFQAFPQEARWEYAYNGRHLKQALEGHDGGLFYHFDHLRMKYGEAIYAPVLWFTWRGIRGRKAADLAVLCWFWLTSLFFTFVATKMEAYTIIAAPAVFIITAVAFLQLGEWMRVAGRYRYALAFVRIALIALPVRYAIERIKPFTILDRNPPWNRQIEALRGSADNSSHTVVYNCPHPIETMFVTNCVAYEHGIDSARINSLHASGYRVIPFQ